MTSDERADLVLAFAKNFYVNGQATEQMVDAAKRLGRALRLRATIIRAAGELQLVADSEHAALINYQHRSPDVLDAENHSQCDRTPRAQKDRSHCSALPQGLH